MTIPQLEFTAPDPEVCTEEEISRLVHAFYARARKDPRLGPIFEAHTGKEPKAEDVAHLLDRPIKEVRRMLSLNQSMMSLDAPLDVDPLLSIGDAIADDHNPAPDLMWEQSEIKDRVQEWLGRLNDKQRYIIEQRYGLNGYETQTLEQLAASLDLTRERVRQIQLEALQTLRMILRCEGISKEGVF